VPFLNERFKKITPDSHGGRDRPRLSRRGIVTIPVRRM
jgi:hypothetical protein